MDAESVNLRRRPKAGCEASNASSIRCHRGIGDGMGAKEQRVNTGSPVRWGERPQLEIREDQNGSHGVTERSVVAKKRVMIVEQRDLSSRATFGSNKRIVIGPKPSNLMTPRQIQQTFNGLSEGEAWLHRVQECWDPCPKAGCWKAARPV